MTGGRPAAAGTAEGTSLPRPAALAFSFAVAAAAWSLGSWLWTSDRRPFAVSVFALGLALGPCLVAWRTVPRSQKPLQRCFVLAAAAIALLAPALSEASRGDADGFFLLLVGGAAGALLRLPRAS